MLDVVDEAASPAVRVGPRPLIGPDSVTGDLRAILEGIGAGITVQAERGRLLFVNEGAARLGGFGSPAEMLAATPDELVGRFQIVDEDGLPFDRARLPGRRVLAGESVD